MANNVDPDQILQNSVLGLHSSGLSVQKLRLYAVKQSKVKSNDLYISEEKFTSASQFTVSIQSDRPQQTV